MDFSATWTIAPRVVAQALGTAFGVYRPSGAGPVVVAGNLVATAPVWITADKQLMADTPLPSGKARGYAAVDPAVAEVGDYLVGRRWDGGIVETWFVESMDLPAPITVVRCNRVLSLFRPGSPVPGPAYYGGDLTAGETALVTGWPGSMLQGTRGEQSTTNLPGDTRLPWVAILLPVLPIVPLADDFAVDELGGRYEISNTVGTAMGWALTAGMAAS